MRQEPYLDRALKNRRQHQQAKQTVNNARNEGQQLNQVGDRPLQPVRKHFGDANCGHQPDPSGEDHCAESDDDRARP